MEKELKPKKHLEKWNSLGNDFLITEHEFEKEEIIMLSDRKFGIGCDQFIIQKGLNIKIYNLDGSESEMCGNALKCLSMKHFKKTGEENFTFSILGKEIKVSMEEGKPSIFFPPLTGFLEEKAPLIKMEDNSSNHEFFKSFKNGRFFYVVTGNPHLICFLNKETNFLPEEIMKKTFQKSLQKSLQKSGEKSFFEEFLSSLDIRKIIEEIGVKIQLKFPATNGINLSFVLNKPENEIFIRTFERGAGETLSCGSAAVAASFCAYKAGIVFSNEIKVLSPGSRRRGEFSVVKIEKEKAALCGRGNRIAEIILSNI